MRRNGRIEMKAIATLSIMALLTAGCATVTPPPSRQATRTRSVTELVNMLNHSQKANKTARGELLRRGAHAVPELTRELERRSSGTISEHDALALTRLVRVFRDMRSDAAVRVCTELVARKAQRVQGSRRARCALLTESLMYLSGSFASADARRAYVHFVTSREDVYLQRNVLKRHWGNQLEVKHLRVDIMSAIPKLVSADRVQGGQVLKHVIRGMSRDGYLTTAVCCLDPNGYDVILSDVKPTMGL